MANNPLQQYFRQPKIYIGLASQGVFNQPGTIQGDVTNLPVYGMTGMDEILIKTPDALLSGESTVKVVESCVPNIKNAWDVSILDSELLFTAIRIATYGNMMGVGQKCPNCSTDNEYDIDLTKILDHLSNCRYDNRVVLKDLIIKIQPLTYRQATDLNIKNYALQQQLIQTDLIEDDTEKQKGITAIWKQLADMQTDVFIASVESIETPDRTVTERNYIVEYLKNCDKEIFDAIKRKIDDNKNTWKFPGYPVKCDSCNHENNLTIELDPSSFFV